MKNQKGITLIALVITIIVLLILAGVSISMVIGENGVLSQADKATIETRKAAAEEDVELAWISADSDYWTDWTDNSSVQRAKYFTEERLDKYLAGKGDVTEVTANPDGTYKVKYISNADDNEYTVVVDANGNAKVEGEGVHKSKVAETKETIASKITAANYGDSVTNYGIDINGDGTVEGDWKIFYSNGTNVFLIASDYVDKTLVGAGMSRYTNAIYPYSVFWSSAPSAMSTTARQDALFGITADSYTLNASNENSKCVSTMLDTANWTGFKDGEGYGEYVIGGPTVEMWMSSWNAKGQLYNTAEETKYESLKTANGANGYYVGPSTTENLTSTYYNVKTNSAEGYNDSLYFPHQSMVSNCNGYWLASPSAEFSYCVLYVYDDGYVDFSYYSNYGYGVRPVVSLSSEVLGETTDDGSWELSK